MLSAAENIGVPMRLSRVDSAAREQRVSALLSLVGLEGSGRKRPHELSGANGLMDIADRVLIIQNGQL
jgi:putative ABC transport system ATP-binding protein